jgi:hypothetical protein
MALDLDDPIEVALATSSAFERAGLEVALYGGLALAATRNKDLEDARTVVEALRGRLDEALLERERDVLAITDHDIRGRYGIVMR